MGLEEAILGRRSVRLYTEEVGRLKIRSKAERIGIGQTLELLAAQRRHRAGLIEPYVFVELARQYGLEIVALQLGFRPVNDPDRPLEARLQQSRGGRCGPHPSQGQQKARLAGFVTQPLVAVGQAPAAPS